jgi:hypothetical protein
MRLGWTPEVHKSKSEHYKKLAKLAIAGAKRAKACSAERFAYYAAALHDYAIFSTHATAAAGTAEQIFRETKLGNAITAVGDGLQVCLRRK